MISDADVKMLTDVINTELFGAPGDELRRQLGLPVADTIDDDNLRDHMGIEALDALAEVENALANRMRQEDRFYTVAEIKQFTQAISRRIGAKWKALAKVKGVDFLTGNPIETGIRH